MCRSGCWLVRRVVRESGVAVVGQSVTASRYVDCVVPCESVEVEERLGLIGRERKLCRVKAVRTSGRERRLCRVKAVRTMAMAGSRQSRVDDGYG